MTGTSVWPHAATNACAEKSGLRGSFLTFNGSKVKCTEKSGLRGSQMSPVEALVTF